MVPGVLEKLQSLQDVLSEKYRIENELKEIPKSLQTKQEILNRLKKTYLEKNHQYEDTRIKLVDLRGKIEQAGKDREQSEAMIVDISTQREYEALLKQIKDASDREQQFRKDLQREEKLYEEISQQIQREESMISSQETEFKAEQEKITDEIEKRNTIVSKLEKQEAQLIVDDVLDPEIIFKFRRIIRKKDGKGIVPLRKGVCTGCNMILPMEFVNEVRSGDHIYFCPYCSMILFHEDSDDTYFTFDLDALHNRQDDEDMYDDEELDEARLMEEEMKEGTDDDYEDEEGEDEDPVADEDPDADVIEDDESSDDISDDIDDSHIVDDNTDEELEDEDPIDDE